MVHSFDSRVSEKLGEGRWLMRIADFNNRLETDQLIFRHFFHFFLCNFNYQALITNAVYIIMRLVSDDSPDKPCTRKQGNLLHWKGVKESSKEQVEKIVIVENGEGLYCKQSTHKLLLSNKICGKMIGVGSSSKNVNEFVSEPFLIDKFSCAYAIKKGFLNYSQLRSNPRGVKEMQKNKLTSLFLAYEYLLDTMELFLIDGHKFGGQFLAYESHPQSNHATYLVFVKQIAEVEVDHISRLAGICKKQALIVSVSEDENANMKVSCEEIKPKISEHKKIASPLVNTVDLIKLKKLIGFSG